jgi:hypothetical protein
MLGPKTKQYLKKGLLTATMLASMFSAVQAGGTPTDMGDVAGNGSPAVTSVPSSGIFHDAKKATYAGLERQWEITKTGMNAPLHMAAGLSHLTKGLLTFDSEAVGQSMGEMKTAVAEGLGTIPSTLKNTLISYGDFAGKHTSIDAAAKLAICGALGWSCGPVLGAMNYLNSMNGNAADLVLKQLGPLFMGQYLSSVGGVTLKNMTAASEHPLVKKGVDAFTKLSQAGSSLNEAVSAYLPFDLKSNLQWVGMMAPGKLGQSISFLNNPSNYLMKKASQRFFNSLTPASTSGSPAQTK